MRGLKLHKHDRVAPIGNLRVFRELIIKGGERKEGGKRGGKEGGKRGREKEKRKKNGPSIKYLKLS